MKQKESISVTHSMKNLLLVRTKAMASTCLGKSFSFGLCMSFVNVYQFNVTSSFPFGFEGEIWDLIVLVPDHCFSMYF